MHRFQHKARLTALAGVAALALAACGGGGGSSSSGGAYGAPANTSTSPAMSTNAGLSAAKVGGVGTVLDTAQGFTLYHLTTEKNGKIQCTGSCAKTWPPVLVTGGNIPAAASSLRGKVSTVKRPDGGVQVTYDGLPLYTYSGDTAAGEANGQGVQGVWFAVTPAGAVGGTTTGSGGGGYGSGGGSGSTGGGGYGSGGGTGGGGGGYGSGGGNG